MAPQSIAQRRWCLRNRERINAEQKRKYQAREIPSNLRPPRQYDHCAVCAKPVPDSRRVDAKYCSVLCERAIHIIRKRARRLAGRESKEPPARLKARDQAWRTAHPEAVRGYSKVRRALRQHVCAEQINAVEVFARDGWRCQLCGASTPPGLRGARAPLSPTLDHIVPLSLGGPHTYQNVQCVCSRCNSRKCAKVQGQFRLF